jgi:hypothetical protein
MKYLILLAFFNFQNLFSQSLNESIISNLPAVLNESSGLERDEQGNFWSHNDSGGEPELYHFSEDGTLLHTLKISNAENIDWEDITLASNGRMFIGDFGNNGNDREDLKILIVNINNLNPGFNLRNASTINFSYVEQTAFPPNNNKKNFDAEAMVYKNDSIFIFTKNRTQPFDGKCYQYYLPAIPGNYQINRSDTLFISGADVESRVVGADFDSITNKLALLTSTKVLIFQPNTSNALLSNTSTIRSFTDITQKEGICWGDSCKLYFTDEYIEALNVGGKLYNAELCAALGNKKVENHEFVIYPNPSNESIFIKLNKSVSEKRNITGELLTSNGEFVKIMQWNITENEGHVNTQNLPKGLYLLHLKENGMNLKFLKVLIN